MIPYQQPSTPTWRQTEPLQPASNPITPAPVSHNQVRCRQPRLQPIPHYTPVERPADQLLSHTQRTIQSYADKIFFIYDPPCKCNQCKQHMINTLENFRAEIMTDQNMLMHSESKLQRTLERHIDILEQSLFARIFARLFARKKR